MTENRAEAELVSPGCEYVYGKYLFYDAQGSPEGEARLAAWEQAQEDFPEHKAMVSLPLDGAGLALALGEYSRGGSGWPWMGAIVAEPGIQGRTACRSLTWAEARDILSGAALGGQTALTADMDPDRGMGPVTAEMEIDTINYCTRWHVIGRLLNVIQGPVEGRNKDD